MISGEFRNQKEEAPALLYAGLLILFGFFFLASLSMTVKGAGRDLAVLFPPSMSLADAVAQMAPLPVDLVRTGYFDNIIVVRPHDIPPLNELKAAGAILIMDAFANGGCLFFKKRSVPYKKGI